MYLEVYRLAQAARKRNGRIYNFFEAAKDSELMAESLLPFVIRSSKDWEQEKLACKTTFASVVPFTPTDSDDASTSDE